MWSEVVKNKTYIYLNEDDINHLQKYTPDPDGKPCMVWFDTEGDNDILSITKKLDEGTLSVYCIVKESMEQYNSGSNRTVRTEAIEEVKES